MKDLSSKLQCPWCKEPLDETAFLPKPVLSDIYKENEYSICMLCAGVLQITNNDLIAVSEEMIILLPAALKTEIEVQKHRVECFIEIQEKFFSKANIYMLVNNKIVKAKSMLQYSIWFKNPENRV